MPFIPPAKLGGILAHFDKNLTKRTCLRAETPLRRAGMGKPFGKASTCLRVGASAKAGANLYTKRHVPSFNKPEFTKSEILRSHKNLKTTAFRSPALGGICPCPVYNKLYSLLRMIQLATPQSLSIHLQ
jgi:hypothetical protein